MKQIWLTTRDLIGKYDLPNTVQGLTKKAKKEGWVKRKAHGVKGGAYEYEVSALINRYNFIKQYESNEPVEFKYNLNQPRRDEYTVQESNVNRKEYEGQINIPIMQDFTLEQLISDNSTKQSSCGFGFNKQWLKTVGLLNEDLMMFQVEDDSMEPSIYDGDMALISTNISSWGNGKFNGVFALLFRHQPMIRRLEFNYISEEYVLKSDNPNYTNHRLSNKNWSDLIIIGKVQRIITKIPANYK
ncbi:S24 family peptidase [Orbaceae bacterium ESL0721]|nr:S24 family peptidase [Orbaceae bacterium ESL0721]